MELFSIENNQLSLAVSALGAEMQRLRFQGKEMLYQGDERYWTGRAPNLFPYVGRMTDKTYLYHGKPYRLDLHGFVKDLVLCPSTDGDTLVFSLPSDDRTLEQYPFDFLYQVRYRLVENSLETTYTVENRSDRTMYFGIGAHPGFQLPIREGLRFEDYRIRFDRPSTPQRILFSDRVHVVGSAPYPLLDQTDIPLDHHLFDRDALVLHGAPRSLTLGSAQDPLAIQVDYPDFAYIGFWHAEKTDAPYICVEPWSSLPSREGIVEEISEQQDLLSLDAGETLRNTYRIRFIC